MYRFANRIQVRKPENFNTITILTLFGLGFVGMFLLIPKMKKINISNEPVIRMGRMSVKIAGWGIFFLIVGIVSYAVGAASDPGDAAGLLFLMCVPCIIVGICLLRYQKQYHNYLKAVEVLLVKLQKSPIIGINDRTIIFSNGKIYKPHTVEEILVDLYQNGTLKFKTNTKKKLVVEVVAPELKNSFPQPAATFLWDCPACGATKQTSSTCEYCGTSGPK